MNAAAGSDVAWADQGPDFDPENALVRFYICRYKVGVEGGGGPVRVRGMCAWRMAVRTALLHMQRSLPL